MHVLILMYGYVQRVPERADEHQKCAHAQGHEVQPAQRLDLGGHDLVGPALSLSLKITLSPTPSLFKFLYV